MIELYLPGANGLMHPLTFRTASGTSQIVGVVETPGYVSAPIHISTNVGHSTGINLDPFLKGYFFCYFNEVVINF